MFAEAFNATECGTDLPTISVLQVLKTATTRTEVITRTIETSRNYETGEKEALQMFCDKENGLRPLMTKPFKNERDEGRVWATDGHVLLIVDPKMTRCKYETGRLGLPTFNDDNCDNLITFDQIEEAFAKFELVREVRRLRRRGRRV